MWTFYVPTMACVLVAVILLIRRYAAPSVPILVRLIASVGWLTSISIVALVPIDVWTTLNHNSSESILILWMSCYWTTQVLTWLLIPIAQGCSDAGDFTYVGRLMTSLRDHIMYYAIIGVVGCIGLGLLLLSGRLHWRELLPLAMTASNTYGLIAVILLLGYGLVAIPRLLWMDSNPEQRLRYYYHRVGRAAEKLEDATLEMQLVATVIEATSQPMSRRDPLRPYMDIIYAEAEATAPLKPSQCPRDERGRVNMEDLSDQDLDYGFDTKGLSALRRRLTRAVGAYNGLKAEYVNAVHDAVRLEVVCRMRASGDFGFRDPAVSRLSAVRDWLTCRVEPWLLKLGSLLLAAMSFMVIWSEATIGSGTHPDLSPFSKVLDGGAHGEVVTQTLISLPLAYMAACCYYSLFRLGIFSFYHVVPHSTESRSLLMNAGQVSRFAAPLAYNFLHVIRMHERLPKGESTVFTQKMAAAMEDVPFFGTSFNTWFPLVVVVYCSLLWLNVYDVLARICIPKRYRFDEETGDDDHTERGKICVRQELEAFPQQEAKGQGRNIGDAVGFAGMADGGDDLSSGRARFQSTVRATGVSPSITQPAPIRGRPGGSDSGGRSNMEFQTPKGSWRDRWLQSKQAGSSYNGAGRLPPEQQESSPLSSNMMRSVAGVSSLTRSLLRNKMGGNDVAARTSPAASGSAPPSGLDDIFGKLASGPAGLRASDDGPGRIDDGEDYDIESLPGGAGKSSKDWRTPWR